MSLESGMKSGNRNEKTKKEEKDITDTVDRAKV